MDLVQFPFLSSLPTRLPTSPPLLDFETHSVLIFSDQYHRLVPLFLSTASSQPDQTLYYWHHLGLANSQRPRLHRLLHLDLGLLLLTVSTCSIRGAESGQPGASGAR